MQEKFLKASWPAPQNIIAFTTLRDTTLGDLQLPDTPILLNQVHGNNVVCIDDVNQTLDADGAISFVSNKVCVVKTADCLPVFICDQQGTQVAVVHCGWRSLAANILTLTCERFKAPQSDCLVWLGPSIGPGAFEVGEDVLEGFRAYGWSDKQLELGFKPSSTGKWLGDLYSLARLTLEKQGIRSDKIYGGGFCTYSDPQRFYSYRRSKDTGRMYNLIWRTN